MKLLFSVKIRYQNVSCLDRYSVNEKIHFQDLSRFHCSRKVLNQEFKTCVAL